MQKLLSSLITNRLNVNVICPTAHNLAYDHPIARLRLIEPIGNKDRAQANKDKCQSYGNKD